MTHKHFCDIAGHLWECEGTTVRPEAGDDEPSLCLCASCQVSIENGDHTNCGLELVPCPDHLHNSPQGNAGDGVPLFVPPRFEEKVDVALRQLECFEASCLWCGFGYKAYDIKAEHEHFAYHCPEAPEVLRENAQRQLLDRHYDLLQRRLRGSHKRA